MSVIDKAQMAALLLALGLSSGAISPAAADVRIEGQDKIKKSKN